MTRQVTDQLYIDLDYFTPEEYYVYTAEAEAAVSSAASVACDATVIAGGVVEEGSGNLSIESTIDVVVSKFVGADCTMTVTTTATAMISHIEGADLFAFSEAQLALEVAVIRGYNIDSSAAFNIAIDAVRGIYVSAQADAAALVDVLGSRSRATEAAVNAAFSLAVDSNITKSTLVDISSQAAISADVNRTRDIVVEVANQFTQTALGGLLVESNIALASVFSIYVDKSAGGLRPIEFVDVDGDPSLILFTTQGQTVNGRANTGQRKYGTHSLLFVASGQPNIVSTVSTYTDFLDVPANTEFAIEFWIYVTADKLAATAPSIVWVGAATRDGTNEINSADNWAVGYGDGTTNNGQLINFSFWNRTTNSRQFIQAASGGDDLDFDVWKHIAVRRDSNGVIRLFENSQELANATYTGALGSPSNGTKLHFGNTGFSSARSGFSTSDSGIFIDEISYRIGSSTISGATQAITGLNDSQRVLLHLDNNLLDDVSGIEQAAAAINSTATLTATATETLSGNASLIVQSNLIAEAQLTSGGNAVLSSEFAQQITIDKIKTAAGSLSSEFAQTANINVSVNVAAALAAQVTQTVDNTRTRDVNIATDAIATQLSAAAKTGNGLVTVEAVAVQTTDAAKITDIICAVESNSALTVAAIKAVDGAVDVSSTTEISAAANRLRSTPVDAVAGSTVTAGLNIIHGGRASLNSSVALLAETSGIISATAALNSSVDVVATVARSRSTSSSIAAEAALTINVVKTVGYAAAMASNSQLSIPGERTRPATITTESVASQLTAIAKTGQGLVTCEVQATLVADCSIIAENEITAEILTQLTTLAVKTVAVSSNLTAVSNSSIEGTTNITIDADLTTEFAIAVAINNIAGGIVLTASAGTMMATVGVIKPLASAMSALAFEVTLGQRSRDVVANLTAVATMTATVGGVFNNQANLQGFAAQMVVGKIIHITPTLTYTVPAENTVYSIQDENRLRDVVSENRNYLIRG